MADIKYDIDKTEDDYIHFEGKSLKQLKAFLYSGRAFEDCCGMITYTDAKKKVQLSVASLKDYGVYIGYSNQQNTYLSLSDKSKLSNVLDVWGDGLYVSEGLFIAPDLAWKSICEFVAAGEKCGEVDWMLSDELPEGGNYI